MNELLPALIPLLGRALLDFVWQGAVIGLVAGIVLAMLGNARPHARYAVGCAALLACVLAPLLDAVLLWIHPSASVFATARLPSSGTASDALAMLPAIAAWPTHFENQLPLVVAMWSAGASVFLLRNAIGLAWIARLRSDTRDTLVRQQWQRRLDALAVRFDLARMPVLRLVDRLDTPASAGWLRPVVLLPAALVMHMPVDQLEALLAHELAHLRRNDYLVNLLQCVVEALLFYHPVVWWLSREVRRERERIADRLAVEVSASPRTLAIALSSLSEFRTARYSTSQLAQAAHGGHLMSRIEQLVRPVRATRAGRFAFPILGLAAACIAFYAHAMHVADQPFALVRADHAGMTLSGNSSDTDDIEAAGRSVRGEYLWFKRDGKAYVVTDPATLGRVKVAWRDTDALSAQMEVLGKEMDQHGKVMDALGRKMDTLSISQQETPAMRDATKRMQILSAQQEALARGMEDQPSSKLDALSREMDALSKQMDEQSRIMESESAKLERAAGPMEALGRQMDQAGKPMEALGTRMDALGKRMDILSRLATRETNTIIDEAIKQRLAVPAP